MGGLPALIETILTGVQAIHLWPICEQTESAAREFDPD